MAKIMLPKIDCTCKNTFCAFNFVNECVFGNCHGHFFELPG